MTGKWIQLSGKDAKDDANGGLEREDDEPRSRDVKIKVYGWDGKLYPRCALTVNVNSANPYDQGRIAPSISLSTSFKQDEESWWGDLHDKETGYWRSGNLPLEIMEDAFAMLKEGSEQAAQPRRWTARDYHWWLSHKEDGQYEASLREFPDLKATGASSDQTSKALAALIDKRLDELYAEGKEIPLPGSGRNR